MGWFCFICFPAMLCYRDKYTYIDSPPKNTPLKIFCSQGALLFVPSFVLIKIEMTGIGINNVYHRKTRGSIIREEEILSKNLSFFNW